MSIYVNEQRDLELMARLVDEIDECTMHSLFYKDVLRSEKQILRTEKTYIKEYMKSLKLIRPLGFIVTALFTLIFFGIYSIGNGDLLQLETIWEMIADIQAAFSTFIKGIKVDMSNIADFESAFGAVCDSLEGAYSQMALFISKSTLSASGMPDFLRYVLYGDVVYIAVFLIYDIYLIFATVKGFFKDTQKVRKFWKEKKRITRKDYAKKQLPVLQNEIEDKKANLEELFYKYNLDKRLMNRENVKLLRGLSYDKKMRNATIKEIERYIISTQSVRRTIETEEYAKVMLAKNERFPYYSKNNLKSKKNEEKKKKNNDILFVLGVIFWPIAIYAFSFWYIFTFCKSILTGTKTFTSVSTRNSSSTEYENNPATDTGYEANETKGPKYGYVDAAGYWREPGEGYVDSAGVWREPGEGYVDASGVWRDG